MSLPEAASATLAVQGAMHDAMLNDATLMNMINGVFDWTGTDRPFPYVQHESAIETPDNTHDRHGSQTVITLGVWSQYRGFKESLTIASRLRALFEHQPLAVTGHDHVATYFVSLIPLVDPEPPGDIRHVSIAFRVLTAVSA